MAENEKEQLKKFIHQLPNAVNGDGKAFVAQLKKALSYLSEHAGGSGGGEDSGEGEDAINQVTALRLTEVHTVDSSGFPKNNIEVTFDNSNIKNYAFAQIWVKDDTENTYQQHGNTNGTRYLFENALVGRTYTVKVVVQLKDGRVSNFDNAPTASILIQGSVLIPDAPTQFFLTWDDDGALWQWQYEENEYIDFFELRLDTNAGVYNDKLLDRTRLPYSRVSPNVRSGTAYLFIRNVFGDYSLPATHIFNKPVGVKPNKPVLQATLDGVVITMSPLPTGYQGYVLEIDGEEFKTINRQFVYYKFSGTVKARYCYYDEIGRGEWSEYESITIKVVLEPDELPEISYDAFDQTIKDAIDGANAQKDINSQIMADITLVQKDVANIFKDISEIESDIKDNIDATTEKFSGVMAEIKATEKELQANIDATQGDINEVISDLNKSASDSPYLSIQQTQDSIKALVGEVERVDGKTNTNLTLIQQNANSVSSLASRVTEEVSGLDKKISTNTSKIEQTADEIRSLVYEREEVLDGKINANATAIATNATQIKQTADSIEATVSTQIATAKGEILEQTTSQITQSANEIRAFVGEEVTTLDGKIATNTSDISLLAEGVMLTVNGLITAGEEIEKNTTSISQNAQGITALSASVSEVNNKVNTQASEIKVLNDQIVLVATKQELNTVSNKVDQNTASIGLTNDSITSVVSKLKGSAQDSGYEALTGLASSIVQTDSSITSVIRELNKDADKCSYTAITQLKDGIDLSVKSEDLTGKEIISRINITPEAITIDGKYVHVTGDTVFDNDVIVGGYIKADTITSSHLKTNSITADKIKAGSITTEKITDKSVTSVKIEDGAITTTKLVNGAVSSTKIEGGAITTEHIQAGSIIGEHISAGAISADKLYAGDIDMTGALALVGGAVRLDENGLTCAMHNGSFTTFDSSGITYFNESGKSYSQIRECCFGRAKHKQHVSFKNQWDYIPSVICVPTNIPVYMGGHNDTNILLKCEASNVTKSGFDMNCYICVPQGVEDVILRNETFVLETDSEIPLDNIIIDSPSDIRVTLGVEGYIGRFDSIGKYQVACVVELYNDGVLVASAEGPAPPALTPSNSWNGRYSETKTTVDVFATVEKVGNLVAKVLLTCVYTRTEPDIVTNQTPEEDKMHFEIKQYSIKASDDIVLDTGEALFIAMSSVNSGYSVSEQGATTYSIRNQPQYKLGV